MGSVVSLWDGLKNAITGSGTARDPRMASAYCARALTQEEVASAYRGSGLLRKIISIPPLDMVREWRDWKAESEQITALEAEEKRLGIRQKMRQAEVLRGLGGGALILGLPGEPSQPAPATVGKGGLAYVHVVSRWHLRFDTLQDDARLPGYAEPAMWRMSLAGGGEATLHPSRVIPFRADTSAALASYAIGGQDDVFWGESTVAQVLDAVKDCDTARASFAALLHKARLTRIGIPGLSETLSLPDGETRVGNRLSVIALAESIHNAAVFDAGGPNQPGETITDVAYSFAGAKDVMEAYATFAAAVSDIPVTRLFGKSAPGLNSSGDGEQRDWAKKIRAQQELELGPCLERLDQYLIPSALGTRPPEVWSEFAPLDLPTDKENADRFFTAMQAVEKLANVNVMPERALNRGVQSYLIAEGFLPELETALGEIDEAERWGIEPDGDATSLEGGQGGGEADVQQLALNGAQVASLAETVLMVERGEIDKETGFHLIRISFPAVPEAAVRGLLAKAGDDPKMKQSEGGDPASAGEGGAANDAAPRTLYVQRKLLNAAEFLAWAKDQGFGETLPADELHVTITYSRTPLDWMKVEGDAWGSDGKGNLEVPPGGARLVEALGDKGAVVLLFNSSSLSWRHEAIKRAGASHDFDEYQPHVTITYQGAGVDLANVAPYRGRLLFGPEIFEELDEDWKPTAGGA